MHMMRRVKLVFNVSLFLLLGTSWLLAPFIAEGANRSEGWRIHEITASNYPAQCGNTPEYIEMTEAAHYALEGCFEREDAAIIVAIAWAESSGNIYACYYNESSDSWDRGILQINDYWHPEVDDACAFSPACAFNAARNIPFTDWVAYSNGAYRNYLDDARDAVLKALHSRVAYLYSSWGMQTMQDEITYLTSNYPEDYRFFSYNDSNIEDLWVNLNKYEVLLIDEDTFYSDSSWSELGGPIYDSFKSHDSVLESFVRNGGAIFTSGENNLMRTQAWDWLPPGMQVTSYDPEMMSNVHVVYDPGAPNGLYSYPNVITNSYLSQGHTHAWFTTWDAGYVVAVRRDDNNEAIELFGVFGTGCIVVSHVEAESGHAWEYMQNQLNFIPASSSYILDILSPQEGQKLYVGQQVTIKVAIKDTAGNPVSGAVVTANSPAGAPISLTEITASPGTGIYAGTHTILPTDPTGDWVITVVASVAGEFPKQAIHTQVLPLIPVSIDIKPSSDPNSINLGAGGVVPVAILTTPDFDASTVDANTVKLAEASVRPKGKSGNAGALEDIDGDGDSDLVVQVNIDELLLAEGDTEAELTGCTYEGIVIKGTDAVNVVRSK